jgi:hypothetical protein
MGLVDAETADRLRVRMGELMARGCRRLIVDLTAASEPSPEESVRLARIFDAQRPSCEVVVVVLPGSAVAGLLPGRVALAGSLSDARRLLGSHAVQRGARRRPGPGSVISASERHALAVRQALRWAERSAGAGDYASALTALATIERVEDPLPPGWQERRQAWLLASRVQAPPDVSSDRA